jgi:hypothetical protein
VKWLGHETRWGVVLRLPIASYEQVDAYGVLPAVQAALDAVPDRLRGLVVHWGRGAGAWVPRRPLPTQLTAAPALLDPELDVFLGPGDRDRRSGLLDDSAGARAEIAGVRRMRPAARNRPADRTCPPRRRTALLLLSAGGLPRPVGEQVVDQAAGGSTSRSTGLSDHFERFVSRFPRRHPVALGLVTTIPASSSRPR